MYSSAAQHKRMTETPIPRLITSLAIPTVLSQLIMVIYNTADTYFVSQISTSASGAVGVVFALQSIIQAVGFGVAMGCQSLVSRRLGEKKDREAQRYANSGLLMTVVLGTLIMTAGLSTLPWLMRLLGATETVLPHACSYARYILCGAPVMCASFLLSNIFRAEGHAVRSMAGLCAGGLLNIALDPLLIFGLHMDISGAALATLISQCVSLLILLSFFLRGKSIVKLDPRSISRSPGTYWQLIKIGFPTICRQGMASVASALLNRGAALYGGSIAVIPEGASAAVAAAAVAEAKDAALAAMTISNKVYMLCRNIVIGIGQGFQPVAGYNYGAGDMKRVKQSFKFSVLVGTAFCVAASIALALTAPQVIAVFRSDSLVVKVGTLALYFCCLSMPLMAYSTFVNQLYQCLGFSLCATILASCRQGIFFIPIVLILPRFIGLTGIQMVQPLSDILTALVSVPFRIAFFRLVLDKKAAEAPQKA